MNKKKISTILILGIIILGIIGGYFLYIKEKDTSGTQQQKGTILQFSIQPSTKVGNQTRYNSGAKAIVYGRNLLSVDVYEIPYRSGSMKGLLVGHMTRGASSESGDTWELILPDGIVAVDFWAEGIDATGATVKSEDLREVVDSKAQKETEVPVWKTYQNNSFGFEFTYHPSFINVDRTGFISHGEELLSIGFGTTQNNLPLFVRVTKTPFDSTDSELYPLLSTSFQTQKKESFLLDGVSAERYTLKNNATGDVCMLVVATHANKVYSISACGFSENAVAYEGTLASWRFTQ